MQHFEMVEREIRTWVISIASPAFYRWIFMSLVGTNYKTCTQECHANEDFQTLMLRLSSMMFLPLSITK